LSKGAPEAIFPRCKAFELDGVLAPMDDARIDELRQEYEHLSRDGFRVLAIASKDVEPSGEPPTMDAMTRRTSSSSICGRKKLREQFEGNEK
jgi:magnesium-transporting ATPase (P-type)